MSGGNFDKLKLYPDGTIVPKGPLELEQGEDLLKLFVWIYQLNEDGTGASVATAKIGNFPHRDRWEIPTTHPDNYDGVFQRGHITCSAMAVSTKNGKTQLYWWAETMMLEPGTKDSA